MLERFEYETDFGTVLDVDPKDPGGISIVYILGFFLISGMIFLPSLVLFWGRFIPSLYFCLCISYLVHHYTYNWKYEKNNIMPLKYVRQYDYNAFFYYTVPYLIIILFFILTKTHLLFPTGLNYFQTLLLKAAISLSLFTSIYLQGSFIMDLVNYHRIVKAPSRTYISLFVLLYVLVGVAFGIFYLLNPNSLNLKTSTSPILDTLYFSFVTLATTGYGDIVPASAYAKVLSIAENITGLLLTAYVIVFIMSIKKTKT